MDCVPIFLDGLKNPDPEVRSTAALALGRTPSSDPAILPALVAALADPHECVAAAAVQAFGLRGGASRPVVSHLRTLATNPAATVRRAVALSLGRIGDQEGGPVLELLLADREPHVRREAAWALGRVGDGSGHGRDALVGALLDQDSGVRYWAAVTLDRLGRAHSLGAALLDPDPGVRLVAQLSLTRAGSLVVNET